MNNNDNNNVFFQAKYDKINQYTDTPDNNDNFEVRYDDHDNKTFFQRIIVFFETLFNNIKTNKNSNIEKNDSNINWIDLNKKFPRCSTSLLVDVNDKILIKCRKVREPIDVTIATHQIDANGVRYFLSLENNNKYIFGKDAEKLGYDINECNLVYSWTKIPKIEEN